MARTARARMVWCAAALAAACAHAPPAAPDAAATAAVEPPPAWPAPPAAPRVRWSASVAVEVRRPEEGWWRRLGRAVLGFSPADDDAPRLRRPFGIASAGDRLWIADPDGPAVYRLAPGGALERVSCRGREWVAPMAIAVAPDGTAYVADGGAGAVIRVPPGGPCAAIGEGTLVRPTGLALAAGRVYAVDPAQHAVFAFAPDGTAALRFGEPGGGPGQLEAPSGLGVDGEGNLLVVDALNFRIARFAPDGRFLGAFGERGDRGGELARPKGVAVDGRGRIFVTDAQRGVVVVFSGDGAFDIVFGEDGERPGQLALPAGIEVRGNQVMVADSGNHRIDVYELVGETP